ncbi:hypothetical protein [Paenibacillus wenxiniae]|uniref:Uncharacterized protein n=1 Tax=Paenibacillus wenxiniae TaxID=1636843 RepID=A0ABW4RNB7_9BACL
MKIKVVLAMFVVWTLVFSLAVAPLSTYAASSSHTNQQARLFGEVEETFTIDNNQTYYVGPLASTGYVNVWLTFPLAAGESLSYKYEWYNEETDSWQVVNSSSVTGPYSQYFFTINHPGYEQLGVYRLAFTANVTAPMEVYLYGEYMAW